jgi:hypothetical protein
VRGMLPGTIQHQFLGEFAQPNALASSTTSVLQRQYLQPKGSPRNSCLYGIAVFVVTVYTSE